MERWRQSLYQIPGIRSPSWSPKGQGADERSESNTHLGPHQMTAPPERIDPKTELSGVVAHHLTKYKFASGVIGPGRVLDVGCGLGYGTAALCSSDRVVIGIDISPDAIAIAKSRYPEDGLTFQQADGQVLPFSGDSCCAVVCLEAIEHFREPVRHVVEVARVLKSSGIYVLSTPRPGTGGAPELNPFHHHEFTDEDLSALLSQHFRDVTLFGQRRRQNRGAPPSSTGRRVRTSSPQIVSAVRASDGSTSGYRACRNSAGGGLRD